MGRTVRIDNVRERPGYFQAVLETCSELVVPIALNRAVVGLFNSEAEVEKHYSASIVADCEDLAEAFAHTLFRLEWRPSAEQSKLPWLQKSPRQLAT